MGAIDTEEAARRLARVILSDIDLYIRERPKAGESREAQIEEGRRLFASRVTPDLVPLFATVLADRAAGTGGAPVVSAARSIAASDAAPAAAPTRPSPAPSPAIDDERATEPSIAVPSSEDQRLSAPLPVAPPVTAALRPPPLVTRPAPAAPAALQPARIPVRRLLAIASVVAAVVALFQRFFR